MGRLEFGKVFCVLTALSLLAATPAAQKSKLKPVAKAPKSIIFAVLNDGETLELIAYVNKGKLEAPVSGNDENSIIAAFNKTYYKPGTAYRLIFGSANAGSVTVKSSDVNAECSKNMAQATTFATKTTLKGLVMGLATNTPSKSTAVSFRRKPTADEKDVIDGLARAEFARQKLTAKVLRFHNLTALDLENDGKTEFVGSYWIEIDNLTRDMLFFIAAKGTNGKYRLVYSDRRTVHQSAVMSGAIKDVDDGFTHELLLDVFDYDGDGTGEIFTYVQSFEGAGFFSYHQRAGKWTRSYEWSNYHCAY